MCLVHQSASLPELECLFVLWVNELENGIPKFVPRLLDNALEEGFAGNQPITPVESRGAGGFI